MSDDEKPFKAEYAKSGRAGCKLCKGNITKETLRMAKMVQSAFYDGRQPNWYHFACFFKGSIVTDTSSVSGFSSLRWADQERIRKKVPGQGDDGTDSIDQPTSTKGKKSGGKRKMTRSDLTIEYAKSSRSSCRGCNSQIDKDEIRIAKMLEAEPDQMKFSSLIPAWHHVDCFLENMSSLEAEGVTPEELTGFTKLKKDSKDELTDKFLAKVGQIKGKKRKKAATKESPPPVKKQKTKNKEEMAEEKALKVQSTLMWKFRDELKKNLSKSELQELLKENNQSCPKGESAILDRLADGMVFGALSHCPDCGGQMVIHSHTYQCHGHMSAWSKCTYSTDDPDRSKWSIPENLKEIPFLKKYKFKARKRLFPKDTSSQPMDVTGGSGPSQIMGGGTASGTSQTSKVEQPLKGFRVFIIGRLSKTKVVLTQQIESLGGRVTNRVTENTTVCLSNKDELAKMGKKMLEVEECEVPVVGEEYLEMSLSGAALIKIPGSTISSWGAPRHSLPLDDFNKEERKFKSTGPSKMKVTVKGAAAVDPESELDHTHHVLEEGKIIWNAVLGLVDISKGTNSYYKLQLLASDVGRNYSIFRAWGRVGTTIGGTKIESFGASLEAAKNSFTTLYRDKTSNEWGMEGMKRPGKFYPLEIDYGQEDSAGHLDAEEVGSTSKLAPEVQQLVRTIFDVESMKNAMREFEIDMKKMPLGKLSRRQMKDAYFVLTELLNEISGNKNPSKIMDASNRFYTLIPHDFGMRKPPPLDNEEVIKLKSLMVDNLLEIEVAYSLLKQEANDNGKNPLDLHYEQLKTDMEVLPKDGEEFKRLMEYVENTHGSTHTMYKLQVEEVFKLVRHGEDEKFKPFSTLHNRQLLWHGSSTTNFCGILSQGLRIAPPEAPVTGYMFGKGVYFADMVTKSANYCRTSRTANTGLMLLCEVALGDMYELTQSKYVKKLPPGKQSTKGLGRTCPDPTGSYIMDGGLVMPMGLGLSSSVNSTSLLYNEYIVYDVSQIRMQYLLKMKFNYV